jgi:palmitoyltransferase ZDHHC9/14/18
VEVLCRPVGFSYLDGHGVATEDQRELNPGVVVQERKMETR